MSVNFKTVFLVAHLCAALVVSDDKFSEYVYYPQLLGYLKLHKEPADWLNARIHCHNEDAILTSPWTTDFTSAVHKLQSNKDQPLPLLFSGALVTYPEEAYYREKLPVELIGVERCGIFLASGTTGEIDCHIKLPFVCYASSARLLAPTPTPTSESTTTPKTTTRTTSTPETTTTRLAPIGGRPSCEGSGYELYSQTGHCYKFHSETQRWTDANRTCTSEDASLVIVNSDIEATVVTSIFGQYPALSLIGANKNNKDIASVGIYWNFAEWRTNDGQTTEQAGYARWRNGLPRNETFYPYGGIHRDGTYSNVHNKALLTFICEKVPV